MRTTPGYLKRSYLEPGGRFDQNTESGKQRQIHDGQANGRTLISVQGKLDDLTKAVIALTVSTMNGCGYCIEVYTAAVRKHGLDDDGLIEVAAVIDLFSGLNKFNTGLDIEMDIPATMSGMAYGAKGSGTMYVVGRCD